MPVARPNRYRTHTCGELRAETVGRTVTLSGWVRTRRDMGGVIFIDLRDREGLTQVVFDPKRSGEELHRQADRLRAEFVVRVSGKVVKRLEGMANPKLATGAVEVEATELEVLSESRTPPFELSERVTAGEDVRLKYRFLDLRRAEMQRNLRIRHEAIQALRRYFHDEGFWDVETPLLGKSTPEGARDYLVPSRLNPGNFYALPQSPQIYKQLLMVAGFDKYYQIPRCLRDEDLRADRQPEFTQLDMEMSFAEQEDVFLVVEGAMQAFFEGGLGLEIPKPFPRLTYEEAMRRFGSDKPDLRFSEELTDVTEFAKGCEFKVFRSAAENGGLVKGFNAKGWGKKKGRAELDRLGERVKEFKAKGLAWFRIENGDLVSNLTKFFTPGQREQLRTAFGAEDGDLLLFGAGEPGIVNPTLDFLRLLWGEEEGKLSPKDKPTADDFRFLWVTDFPLFSWSAEERRWTAEHHPFTSPDEQAVKVLLEAARDPAAYRRPDSPLKDCKAVCYDLVLNGSEIASGSVRIHRGDLQQAVFQVLDLSEEDIRRKFGFFIDALCYGTPPHAGIAWGLDRIVTLMTGSDSIREVIAFPKNQRGADIMSGAPSPVDQRQLDELRLRAVAPPAGAKKQPT